ncbi:MAG: hypothetical protein P1U58_01295 [Verrucomicrobiales bacterium]|nr:hypothetical protein [Verrucomicrobiales bacterium]
MVTTAAISGVTTSSALVGGEVTDDGGVVISTFPTPSTASGAKAVSGSGTGVFSDILTGLSPSTTYYVRSYAINSAGTGYGPQVNFTTAASARDAAVTNVLKTALTKKYKRLKKSLKRTKSKSKKKQLMKKLKIFKKRINSL